MNAVFIKKKVSLVTFELLDQEINNGIGMAPFEMYPVDCPWIIFIGFVCMRDIRRNNEKIACADHIFLFTDLQLPFAFYTIDKDMLVGTMRAFPVMKFCVGVETNIRDIKR